MLTAVAARCVFFAYTFPRHSRAHLFDGRGIRMRAFLSAPRVPRTARRLQSSPPRTTARTRARAMPQRWLASMTKKFNDAKDDDDASTSTTKTTKEDLGRATWTFLHTFAAQYPDEPTRRQERDARELIMILTRAYPCGECAAHFAEIVRVNPPDCSSGLALQRWMCAVHNEVNASLGKAWFDCAKVDGRWSKLECDESDASPGCSLEGRRRKMMR